MKRTHTFRTTLAAMSVAALVSACEADGPLEQAGKRMDKAVDEAKNVLTSSGPLERAGEKADDAVREAGQQASQALEKAGEQIERATKG